MRLFILIALISISKDIIYNRTKTNKLVIEISKDSNNRCLNNIKFENITKDTIEFKVVIFRGDIWYFKHQLKMRPGEIKYYNDGFTTCDRISSVSVEINDIK